MATAAQLLAAVKEGDAPAVERIVARDPELAGALEDGVPAVRLAIYHRQPAVLEALLAAQPPLDGLDHAALGWVDDLRAESRRTPSSCGAARPTGSPRCTTRASSAARPRSPCCWRRAPTPHVPADNDIARAAVALRRGGARRRGGAAPARRRRRPGRAVQAGGFTALQAAAQHDDEATAAALLRHGADPSCATSRARTRQASRARASPPRCSRCSASSATAHRC